MTWQPLSQRRSGSAPDGPYEGIPPHLGGHLADWLTSNLIKGEGRVANDVAIRLRIPLRSGLSSGDKLWAILESLDGFDHVLDAVDATLYALKRHKLTSQGGDDVSVKLRRLLNDAASVWTVSEQGDCLIAIVEQHAQQTYEEAVAPQDDAAAELRTAWANAFGRNGDPSDAWDHAIKAVEDTLAPVVIPNTAKPTLGLVIRELTNQPQLWKLILPGSDKTHSVEPLVTILRLMWPNHDRHGGATKRIPSTEEARSVVGLAALIIQWQRQGWVVDKR